MHRKPLAQTLAKMCLGVVVIGLIASSACYGASAHLKWSDRDTSFITDPIVVRCSGPDDVHSTTVAVGDRIVVYVANLESLLHKAQTASNLVLVIDNVKLEGIRAYNVDTHQGAVYFHLSMHDIQPEHRSAWGLVFGTPCTQQRSVTLTIAIADGGLPIRSVIDKRSFIDANGVIRQAPSGKGYCVNLFLVQPIHMTVAVMILAFFVFGIWHALKSDMLRASRAPNFPEQIPGQARVAPPYSLAVAQICFWFVCVILSTMFLWMITGQYVPMSNTILGILGISAFTSLSAVFIDHRKQHAVDDMGPPRVSKNFLRDIIADINGETSFFRIQMVVWTVLFGFFFLYQTFVTITSPELHPSMLILMGLSSTAYLTGKANDRR